MENVFFLQFRFQSASSPFKFAKFFVVGFFLALLQKHVLPVREAHSAAMEKEAWGLNVEQRIFETITANSTFHPSNHPARPAGLP